MYKKTNKKNFEMAVMSKMLFAFYSDYAISISYWGGGGVI